MSVRIAGRRPGQPWLVALACLALSPAARAALDPFTVTVGETLTHDSNIFRAPSADAVADTQSDTRLRVDYNSPIGRGQATAWASADAARYRHDKQLDYEGYLVGGEFDWASLERLSGKLGFADFSSLYRPGLSGDQAFDGKSILHTRRAFTRAALGGNGPFGIEAGADFSSSKNSAAALALNDLDQWVGDLGAYYMPSPDLRITVTGRRSVGKYPNFIPEAISFARNDLLLGGKWAPGGFTNVEAQAARTQEDYSMSSARHFWTGFVRGNWQVTGHITLSASVARDSEQNFQGGVLGSSTSAGSAGGAGGADPGIAQQSLSMNDAIDFSGRWQLTSKIELTGSYLRSSRRYDDVLLGAERLNGSDTSSIYLAGFNYQVSRGVRAGCTGSRTTHAPGALVALGGAYAANAYACFAELSLR